MPAPEDGPGQYELGVRSMFGRGVPASLAMAGACFLRAADAHDPRGLYAAGMMYLRGIGLSADPDQALVLLETSARLGYAPARRVLDALAQGRDVTSSPIVAVAAASAGTLPATRPSLRGVAAVAALSGAVAVGWWMAAGGAGPLARNAQASTHPADAARADAGAPATPARMGGASRLR